ncbi:hypothetical protein QWZ13_09850 [Reinekea marina]|nr:hypothetical protein [Reinekea marina]MDN3649214.1 hypothetical protein [Reinekea marina]
MEYCKHNAKFIFCLKSMGYGIFGLTKAEFGGKAVSEGMHWATGG